MKNAIIAVLVIIVVILGYNAIRYQRAIAPTQQGMYKITKTYDEGKIPEEKEPVVTTKKEDQKIATLRILVQKYPEGVISECNYKSITYFSLYPHYRLADAETEIYNINGNKVASGGGFVATSTSIDPMYKNIRPNCNKLIYNPGVYDTNTGQITKVDVYNLSN